MDHQQQEKQHLPHQLHLIFHLKYVMKISYMYKGMISFFFTFKSQPYLIKIEIKKLPEFVSTISRSARIISLP